MAGDHTQGLLQIAANGTQQGDSVGRQPPSQIRERLLHQPPLVGAPQGLITAPGLTNHQPPAGGGP